MHKHAYCVQIRVEFENFWKFIPIFRKFVKEFFSLYTF